MRVNMQQGERSSSRIFPLEGVTIGGLSRLTGFNAKAIRYYAADWRSASLQQGRERLSAV